MLSSVVDQCLSMAIASASRKMGLVAGRDMNRSRHWQAPLAAYPRLASVLAKAEAEGVLARRQIGRSLH